MKRRAWSVALVAVMVLVPSCTHVSHLMVTTAAKGSGVVTVSFYDRHGNLLTPSEARSVMTNGSAGWTNDAGLPGSSLSNFNALRSI